MIVKLRRVVSLSAAASKRVQRWAGIGLGIVSLLILTRCASSPPGSLPVQRPIAIATATATLLPTSTPTAVPTATPMPTPTPPAVRPAGILPSGQLFFSTKRAGERWAELWQADAQEGVHLAQPDVMLDLWQCGTAGEAFCTFVTRQGALQVLWPVSGTLALLDDLPVLYGGHDVSALNSTATLSATLAVSTTGVISESGVPSIAPGVSANLPVSVTRGFSPSATSLVLALSPDGTALALAGDDGIKIYDLESPSLAARALVTNTTALAWSPDSSTLAIAYPSGDDTGALAMWNWQEGEFRLLAAMQSIGDLTWSPDGAKLAFAARRQPPTPASQGSQSDVYVLFLKSGEIANLTEVFLGNNGLPVEQQIGAWSPSWEPDSAAVRYVLGVPGAPDTQSMMRHALRSRRPTILGSVPEAGISGLSSSPSGQVDARVVERNGREIVQVRPAGGDWSDSSPGTLSGIHDLVWAPSVLQSAPSGDFAQARYLLLVASQALYVLDVTSGSIGGVAVACSECTIHRAVWLP